MRKSGARVVHVITRQRAWLQDGFKMSANLWITIHAPYTIKNHSITYDCWCLPVERCYRYLFAPASQSHNYRMIHHRSPILKLCTTRSGEMTVHSWVITDAGKFYDLAFSLNYGIVKVRELQTKVFKNRFSVQGEHSWKTLSLTHDTPRISQLSRGEFLMRKYISPNIAFVDQYFFKTHADVQYDQKEVNTKTGLARSMFKLVTVIHSNNASIKISA